MADWKEVRNPKKVEGLAATARIVERNLVETCFIATAALQYAGEDMEEAKRLLRKTTFRYYGQTWGESLFIADGGRKLPDVGEVVGTLMLVSEEAEDEWRQEVVNRTAREMMKNPVDIPLYLAQIADLAGREGLDLFTQTAQSAAIAMPEERVQRKANELYLEIAGQSYWEMEINRPALFLFDIYSTWKQMQTLYGRSGEEIKPLLEGILADARSSMRRLARVVLGRNLIHKGEFMGASNGLQLTHEEVVSFLD